jgi:hypothetical protein
MFTPSPGTYPTNLVKLTLICGIFLTMATLYARAAGDSIEKLADDPACARALAWIDTSSAWLTDQQIHLTEIPAPEFKEAPRAEYLKKADGFRPPTNSIARFATPATSPYRGPRRRWNCSRR